MSGYVPSEDPFAGITPFASDDYLRERGIDPEVHHAAKAAVNEPPAPVAKKGTNYGWRNKFLDD